MDLEQDLREMRRNQAESGRGNGVANARRQLGDGGDAEIATATSGLSLNDSVDWRSFCSDTISVDFVETCLLEDDRLAEKLMCITTQSEFDAMFYNGPSKLVLPVDKPPSSIELCDLPIQKASPSIHYVAIDFLRLFTRLVSTPAEVEHAASQLVLDLRNTVLRLQGVSKGQAGTALYHEQKSGDRERVLSALFSTEIDRALPKFHPQLCAIHQFCTRSSNSGGDHVSDIAVLHVAEEALTIAGRVGILFEIKNWGSPSALSELLAYCAESVLLNMTNGDFRPIFGVLMDRDGLQIHVVVPRRNMTVGSDLIVGAPVLAHVQLTDFLSFTSPQASAAVHALFSVVRDVSDQACESPFTDFQRHEPVRGFTTQLGKHVFCNADHTIVCKTFDYYFRPLPPVGRKRQPNVEAINIAWSSDTASVDRVCPDVAFLLVPYFKGSNMPTIAGQFIPVVTQCARLHAAGLVHGDIWLGNMIFVDETKAFLLDFDWTGADNLAPYPVGYMYDSPVLHRHSKARPLQPLRQEHDRYALGSILIECGLETIGSMLVRDPDSKWDKVLFALRESAAKPLHELMLRPRLATNSPEISDEEANRQLRSQEFQQSQKRMLEQSARDRRATSGRGSQ